MRKTSVIPSGVTLVGDIEGDADLVVYGRVEGPIHVGGTLVIEGSGVVRGHVRASAVIVRGVLKGNAFGDELVRVDEGARLVGELTAPRVQVVPGAHFRGQIHVATVGEPRLTTYDPTLHTFSGWPSPEPFEAVGSSRSSLGSGKAPSAHELPTAASKTFDEAFTPVGMPHVGEASDVTLLEASAPDRTQVVDPADSETTTMPVFQPGAPEPTRVVDPADSETTTMPVFQPGPPDRTQVVDPADSETTTMPVFQTAAAMVPAAAPHVSHASPHDPAATHVSHPAAPHVSHAPALNDSASADDLPASELHDAHASASHDDPISESLDVDATLSEATTYPPPPERLPPRMPRLGGRTPGTRRWT